MTTLGEFKHLLNSERDDLIQQLENGRNTPLNIMRLEEIESTLETLSKFQKVKT